jgi:two-component system, cell cycle response regulator
MGARVLIVDDVAVNRIVQHARLASAFYEPLLAPDGAGCLAVARQERPDLVLLDLGLPGLSGLDTLRQLRRDPLTRDILVVALTETGTPDERMAAFAAGADDVMDRPANERVLLARVRNLLRSRGESEFPVTCDLGIAGFSEASVSFDPNGLVALVSNRQKQAETLKHALAGQLRDQMVVMTREEALADAAAVKPRPAAPDVYIIHDDGSHPSAALRLLSELKSHQTTRHAAVCVVGPPGEGDEAAMAFDLGADDAVGPEVTSAELALRTHSLLRRKRQGDRRRTRMEDSLRLAIIDPLTGLFNRRYAEPQLAAIASRSQEDGTHFAVMVVDLDRFKQVNDVYGHAVGDQVLVEVAHRLTANLRDTDVLARIGGEEFLAILPQSCMTVARRVAERLCAAMNDQPIRLASGQELRVTISIGVAVAGTPGERVMSTESLVEQADMALLESKGAGRNQVTYRLSAA